jgi:hypothetical protein
MLSSTLYNHNSLSAFVIKQLHSQLAKVNMISIKKLITMARKWQKLAAMQRKRILYPRKDEDLSVGGCSTSSSSVAEKGHFVVYSADQRRFVIPLAFLNNDVFRQLLEMSEEEFGIPGEGPIRIPCDGVFMDYIISLIQKGIAEDPQKALLFSLATGRCCSSSSVMHQEWRNRQLLVY